MKINLIIILIFLSSFAEAQVLGPFAKLNRISRVLRGYQPSPEERQQLQTALDQNRLDSFLEGKIDEYLNSEAHALKMQVRLDELFQLKTSGHYDWTKPLPETHVTSNAMDFLFAEMGRKNLPWDTLLTGKSYRAFARTQMFGMDDYGFLAGLVPTLDSPTGTYSPLEPKGPFTDLAFDPKDPRIAGAITTARFFTRFVTTGLNKNRKRAAVLFRVFLCDSMSAAVTSSEGKDDEIYDVMFPHGPHMTEEELRKSALNSGQDLHGSSPDCMACHSKLDPMGRTMITSPLSLHPVASPGALNFPRGTTRVNIPVGGIGELGLAITQQPEYELCQVQHFWRWFMDERLTLTTPKQKLLVDEFNKVGRRTNDFIKVLLHQPEFSTVAAPLTENEIRARQVKAYFKRCQDCHRNHIQEGIPDFTQWPIGGDKAKMKEWIGYIEKELDLPHDGENPKMPPPEAAWGTNIKEINLIKKWIELGGPDEKGERLLQ